METHFGNYKLIIICRLIFTGIFILCNFSLINNYELENKKKEYMITRVSQSIEIDGIWEKEPWKNIPHLSIDKHIGKLPEHKPIVQAKVAYDNEAIYIIFRVQDQYVQCVTEQYQGSVYKDSCVEFFFTPGPDVSKGYFNLELNCIGTGLFKFHDIPTDNLIEIPRSEFNQIEIAHSISDIVIDEIQDPITWTIEYKMPFSIINKYIDTTSPRKGDLWRANFYKIANGTSHPHWLSWSKLNLSKLDFHRPEFFGILKF